MSGAYYTMVSPRRNNERGRMLGVGAVVVISTGAFIIGYTFAVNSILSSPKNNNADTTSSVLLRGEGKEELLPVVAFTTRAEKCIDTKILPPLDFAADVFKGQFKSQSSEDKTLLENFCKFLLILYEMHIYLFLSYLVYERTLTNILSLPVAVGGLCN